MRHFLSASPLENHLKIRWRMTNRKRNSIYNEKQRNYSSPQLSKLKTKREYRSGKWQSPGSWSFSVGRGKYLPPANPAKLRTGGARQHGVKQANRGGTERLQVLSLTPSKRQFRLWRPNQRDLHSEAPGKPCRGSVGVYSLPRDLQLLPCAGNWGSQSSTSVDRRFEDSSLDKLDGFWEKTFRKWHRVSPCKKAGYYLFSSNKTQSTSTTILIYIDITFNHFLNALCLTMNGQRTLVI